MAAKSNLGPAQEIVITRRFAAPRDLVFAAWTESRHLARWWGPQGFTNPVCQWDAKAGGKIYDIMRGPDGTDYPMGGEFREIVAPEKLVMVCGALDARGALMFEFQHTVTFTAEADATIVTVRSHLLNATPGSERYTNGYRAGMTSSLEKLAELVEAIAPREIVSTRALPAPPAQVYAAFSDRLQLALWWGPKGFTNTFETFDLRPGGRWRFTMHGPDGTDYPAEKEFSEVVPAERIVFRHRQVGHNFQMTMTFSPANGGTRLTWSMLFDSADECVPVRNIIIEANEQNLDRLAAHLSATGPVIR